MTKALRFLTEKLRGEDPPAHAWVTLHGGRLPCALLAVMLPFVLSGAVRAATSFSLPLSLGLTLVLCAAMTWLLLPWLRFVLREFRRPGTWIVEAAGLLVVGAAMGALYVHDFGGFPNLDGWDGGSHVFVKDQFATFAPSLYSGQVTHHALAWWLEKLFAIDSFRSFTVIFYLVTIGIVAIPLAVIVGVVREASSDNRAAFVTGMVAAVLGSLMALWLVVLPLLHYNQAAGYYPQVFGLLPLAALWAADALIRRPVWRVLALLAGFLLLRYTYVLNLADAALAVAAVLLMEGFRGRWRLVQLVVVAGLTVLAWRIVIELRPVFRVWGGMQRFDVDSVLGANLLVACSAAAYLLANPGKGPRFEWLRSPLLGALRFPLAYVFAGSALLHLLRKEKGVQYYYVTKYQVWACILIAFVLVILFSHLAVSLAQRSQLRKPSLWLRVAILSVLVAQVPAIWSDVFIRYRTTLAERVLAKGPPYRRLYPLADPWAIARIKKVLAAEKKQFGGYLTAFYPMFSFMNATLGRHAGVQEFFPPDVTPGHCVFWVSGERDLLRLGPAHVLDRHRAGVIGDAPACVEYAVPWKTTPHSFCQRCY